MVLIVQKREFFYIGRALFIHYLDFELTEAGFNLMLIAQNAEHMIKPLPTMLEPPTNAHDLMADGSIKHLLRELLVAALYYQLCFTLRVLCSTNGALADMVQISGRTLPNVNCNSLVIGLHHEQ